MLNPISRIENFLARIAGDPGAVLTPKTRIEHFLQRIIDAGRGGGDVSPESVLAALEEMTVGQQTAAREAIGATDASTSIPDSVKVALLDCFDHGAWADNQKQICVGALIRALYPLDHITAVYTQSGTVYNTDSLDSLKPDLVVTATYENGDTATIPSTDYTLSGTLTVGTSTITVTYQDETDTFDVTVSELEIETGYISIGNPNIANNILTTGSAGSVRTKSVFSPGSSPWKIRVGFTNTDSSNSYKDVFGSCNSSGTSQFGILLEKASSYGTFLSGNGSSWNISNAEMTFAKHTNTHVIYELEFTGSLYRVHISTDGGTTFGSWVTKTSSAAIKGGNYIGFGISRNGYHSGTINLAECMIWIDGRPWWKAVA